MDSFIALMEIAGKFPDDELNSSQRKASEKENSKLVSQMTAFSDLLKAGNTIDLKAKLADSNISALTTVEVNYLNDPHMSDLVEGKFFILGKVIRCVETSESSISFIRKSALSKMPQNIIDDILNSLSNLNKEQDFQLPKNQYSLAGPAFQVIPVAIYA